MDFGSKFVYDYSDSEEEEISEDAIETGADSVPDDAAQAISAPTSRSVRGGGRQFRPAPPPAPSRPLPRRPSSSIEVGAARGSNRSSAAAGAGQKWRRADTNVVVVKFDCLTEPSNMHTGDPIVCSGCQVMLSHISKITEHGKKKVDLIWTCEFCATKNEVDIVSEEIPSKANVTYILEPAAMVAVAGDGGASGRNELQESIVVFCIDYSGSMGKVVAGTGNTRITRLDGVKRAVCHQLERLADSSPGCRVAVVAFESSVKVIADGKDMPEHRVGNDVFNDKTKLLEVATHLNLPSRISDSRKVLTQNVLRESQQGSTALGPGLLVSVGIARQMARSKVIVCTDGQANVGLGSLQNQQVAYAFYTEVANIAKESGVSVSVLTIAETNCRLVELGRVAELTGGQVNVVDPHAATEEFGNILEDTIVATHAAARFFVHRDLYVRGEPDRPSHALRDIGNVTRGTEVSFEYGVRPKKKPKPIDGCKDDKKRGDNKRDEPDDDGDAVAVAVETETTTAATDDFEQKHGKVSTEPTAALAGEEPTRVTMAQELANQPAGQKPAKNPEAQKPANQPADQEPAREPAVQEPANQPAGQEPAREPAVQEPVAQEPVNQPAGQEPAKEPVAQKPANQPMGQEPAKVPVIPEPANLQVDHVPSNAPVIHEPGFVPKDTSLFADRPFQLPFQVQIRYTDSNGSKAVRVFTETKPITKDRGKAESSMNIPVLGTHAVRDAADKAINAQYMESRLTDFAYSNMFNRKAKDSEHFKHGLDMYERAAKPVKGSVMLAQKAEARSQNSTVMDAEKALKNMGYDEVRKQRRHMFDDSFAKGCYQGMKLSSSKLTGMPPVRLAREQPMSRPVPPASMGEIPSLACDEIPSSSWGEMPSSSWGKMPPSWGEMPSAALPVSSAAKASEKLWDMNKAEGDARYDPS